MEESVKAYLTAVSNFHFQHKKIKKLLEDGAINL